MSRLVFGNMSTASSEVSSTPGLPLEHLDGFNALESARSEAPDTAEEALFGDGDLTNRPESDSDEEDFEKELKDANASSSEEEVLVVPQKLRKSRLKLWMDTPPALTSSAVRSSGSENSTGSA